MLKAAPLSAELRTAVPFAAPTFAAQSFAAPTFALPTTKLLPITYESKPIYRFAAPGPALIAGDLKYQFYVGVV